MNQTPKKQRLGLWGAALMPSSCTPTPPKVPPSSCERSSQYIPGKWAHIYQAPSIACPLAVLAQPMCKVPSSSPAPKNTLLLLPLNGCTAHYQSL